MITDEVRLTRLEQEIRNLLAKLDAILDDVDKRQSPTARRARTTATAPRALTNHPAEFDSPVERFGLFGAYPWTRRSSDD